MTLRLDALLGRVTMYRLVILVLAALQALAALFAALGLVRVAGPLDMAASFAVLLGVALLVHVGLAAAFRVRAHLPSTVITAQLLFFLLAPTLDPARLGGLAMAAALAIASKYLLAIRGRHVVNPAAFGVLAVALLSAAVPALQNLSWWIGTDWMLPPTAVGALLVLHRTRRLPMAGVFVLVAAVAGVAYYLLLGAALPDAARFAVVNAPIVFLAGFMLSEPLTLAPRRRQQLAIAALVGILMWTTAWIPVVGNHPELALLVGNLVAFLAGQRRGIRLEYRERVRLSPTAWEFVFAPLAPLAFRAGQFVELHLPHAGADGRGSRRTFSIASAPGDLVRIGIRLPERVSSFKRALLALEPGTVVGATSVGGDFVLPADRTRPLLLVAGGIGVTPFVGHLEQAAREGRDVVVVYAVPSPDELAYADRLERAGCRVVVACSSSPATLPAGWTWLGPDRLTGDALLAAVPDAARRTAYLSGPPAMVSALRRALRRAGVRRIRTDVFIGS